MALLAVMPVTMAVLIIYAVMGFSGIRLSVGTLMFAAIAIGTGVDFAVYMIDRLIELTRKHGHRTDEAFAMVYASTGRALLFNFAAVFLGFGSLMTSHVPPLILFGVLITVSIATSLTVLPALVVLLQPAFLRRTSRRMAKAAVPLLATAPAEGPLPPSGDEIARRVNARDYGRSVSRVMTIDMIDRRGKKRTRRTRTFRKQDAHEKRMVIFYVEPKNVKDTAFLNIDYAEAGRDDDRWLYLPAAGKVSRLAASDRGKYFLGTDLTYEDINQETKVNTRDFKQRFVSTEPLDQKTCLVMEFHRSTSRSPVNSVTDAWSPGSTRRSGCCARLPTGTHAASRSRPLNSSGSFRSRASGPRNVWWPTTTRSDTRRS